VCSAVMGTSDSRDRRAAKRAAHKQAWQPASRGEQQRGDAQRGGHVEVARCVLPVPGRISLSRAHAGVARRTYRQPGAGGGAHAGARRKGTPPSPHPEPSPSRRGGSSAPGRAPAGGCAAPRGAVRTHRSGHAPCAPRRRPQRNEATRSPGGWVARSYTLAGWVGSSACGACGCAVGGGRRSP
jgi:hypothetical protein